MKINDPVMPIKMKLKTPIIDERVIPNPPGDPTDDLTKVQIQGNIYQIKDPEVHDWARTEEKPTYTKAEVGLGEVDNTSDLDKPISTATQDALDGKVDNSELDNYYTKSEVDSALDNKADKSDTYTKTETDNLLSAKADSSSVYTKTETDTALDNKVDKVTGKGLSTNDYDDTAKGIVDGVPSALADKVDKVEGYGLSENDYTDEEKSKVGEIDNKLDKTETAVNSNGLVIATPVNDTAPYIYRQTPVKESFKALMHKIVGASVVWNQIVKNGNFANTSNWDKNGAAEISVSNNVLTLSCASGNPNNRLYQPISTITGHKYILNVNLKASENISVGIQIKDTSSQVTDAPFSVTTTWSNFKQVLSVNGNNYYLVIGKRTSSANAFTIDFKNIYCVDLTAMFGTTIADYVYTLETSEAGSGIAWLQSYGFFTEDYYAYKQNKLESVCVSAHKTYDGETLLTNTELSPITIRGLFKLSTDKLTVDGDEYNADGSVNRKYLEIDLGDYTWRFNDFGDNSYFDTSVYPYGSERQPYCFSSMYIWVDALGSADTNGNMVCRIVNTYNLRIRNLSYTDAQTFTTAMKGVKLIYDLNTGATTEQTTPFTETEIVGSTEEFIDYEVAQGNRDVAIPVGTETDYYQEMKLPSLPTTSGNHNLIYNPSTGFGWT